jgi:hypothetical protein
LSTAGRGRPEIHSKGGRQPAKERRLSIALMIHSWDPSKMGEVEHEKGNCDVSIALVDSRKGGVRKFHSNGGRQPAKERKLSIALMIHSWDPSGDGGK